MRTYRRLSIFLILLGVALHAQAQQPAATPPPLPPGPLINRAPDPAQWLVSVKSGSPSTDPAPIPDPRAKYDKRMLVRKSGAIRYEILVDGTGQRLDRWFMGIAEATFYPGQNDPVVTMEGATIGAGGRTNYTDYSKSDFPDFDWITAGNYTGIQTCSGLTCIVFHDGPATLASPAANAAAPPVPVTGKTAYIEIKSRLPVRLEVDDVANYYQWEQPPPTPLTLPQGVQDKLAAIQANAARAAIAPAGP